MSKASRLFGFSMVMVPLLVAASLFMSPAGGQQAADQTTTTDEQRLIQAITHEVMKELKEGEFLRQQIEQGIQDHIKKRKESQVAARAEKARVTNEKAKNVRRVSRARDHIYGDPNAPISLIEYSDFECPYCKHFHLTPKKVVEAYKGQVNWVYRHFPLNFHNPGAQKQAEASECANALGGDDAFWQYTDAIYARTLSNGKGFSLAKLTPLATELGLDTEQFRQCLDSGIQAARVKEDLAEGVQIGVTGTPASILLHNQTGATSLKTGAQSVVALKAEIDKLLK